MPCCRRSVIAPKLRQVLDRGRGLAGVLAAVGGRQPAPVGAADGEALLRGERLELPLRAVARVERAAEQAVAVEQRAPAARAAASRGTTQRKNAGYVLPGFWSGSPSAPRWKPAPTVQPAFSRKQGTVTVPSTTRAISGSSGPVELVLDDGERGRAARRHEVGEVRVAELAERGVADVQHRPGERRAARDGEVPGEDEALRAADARAPQRPEDALHRRAGGARRPGRSGGGRAACGTRPSAATRAPARRAQVPRARPRSGAPRAGCAPAGSAARGGRPAGRRCPPRPRWAGARPCARRQHHRAGASRSSARCP